MYVRCIDCFLASSSERAVWLGEYIVFTCRFEWISNVEVAGKEPAFSCTCRSLSTGGAGGSFSPKLSSLPPKILETIVENYKVEKTHKISL